MPQLGGDPSEIISLRNRIAYHLLKNHTAGRRIDEAFRFRTTLRTRCRLGR